MIEIVGHRKISVPRHNFSEFFGFVLERFQFISAICIFPGKIYVKDFGSLIMSSICCLDLENKTGNHPGMMQYFSREEDDCLLVNISSQDVPYASRIT